MKLALTLLLVLIATTAEARYVRVWGWAWQPDRPRIFERYPMARRQIRSVYPGFYRSSWDLGEQEREAFRWARHCRVMYQALHYQPYGCR